jgi:hypothetical protein
LSWELNLFGDEIGLCGYVFDACSLMRRFDMQLFEMTQEDVEFYYNWVVPHATHARLDSNGVRVLMNAAA